MSREAKSECRWQLCGRVRTRAADSGPPPCDQACFEPARVLGGGDVSEKECVPDRLSLHCEDGICNSL